ncbi:hypothetical protein PAPYR_2978 [Paratrimastix pyriformis]|uniref:Nucleolar 27S pre-rRNA processing Urb2/Npa2 C-terminal domain-containing protein n=1 Tax=Paratrimastix pyriformis TaxID=342808 RepID=A0ABQ8USQ2_9EUKA|nr:hypothetical protein PAPYR_2978 [Paratrimastix pyriformis]
MDGFLLNFCIDALHQQNIGKQGKKTAAVEETAKQYLLKYGDIPQDTLPCLCPSYWLLVSDLLPRILQQSSALATLPPAILDIIARVVTTTVATPAVVSPSDPHNLLGAILAVLKHLFGTAYRSGVFRPTPTVTFGYIRTLLVSLDQTLVTLYNSGAEAPADFPAWVEDLTQITTLSVHQHTAILTQVPNQRKHIRTFLERLLDPLLLLLLRLDAISRLPHAPAATLNALSAALRACLLGALFHPDLVPGYAAAMPRHAVELAQAQSPDPRWAEKLAKVWAPGVCIHPSILVLFGILDVAMLLVVLSPLAFEIGPVRVNVWAVRRSMKMRGSHSHRAISPCPHVQRYPLLAASASAPSKADQKLEDGDVETLSGGGATATTVLQQVFARLGGMLLGGSRACLATDEPIRVAAAAAPSLVALAAAEVLETLGAHFATLPQPDEAAAAAHKSVAFHLCTELGLLCLAPCLRPAPAAPAPLTARCLVGYARLMATCHARGLYTPAHDPSTDLAALVLARLAALSLELMDGPGAVDLAPVCQALGAIGRADHRLLQPHIPALVRMLLADTAGPAAAITGLLRTVVTELARNRVIEVWVGAAIRGVLLAAAPAAPAKEPQKKTAPLQVVRTRFGGVIEEFAGRLQEAPAPQLPAILTGLLSAYLTLVASAPAAAPSPAHLVGISHLCAALHAVGRIVGRVPALVLQSMGRGLLGFAEVVLGCPAGGLGAPEGGLEEALTEPVARLNASDEWRSTLWNGMVAQALTHLLTRLSGLLQPAPLFGAWFGRPQAAIPPQQQPAGAPTEPTPAPAADPLVINVDGLAKAMHGLTKAIKEHSPEGTGEAEGRATFWIPALHDRVAYLDTLLARSQWIAPLSRAVSLAPADADGADGADGATGLKGGAGAVTSDKCRKQCREASRAVREMIDWWMEALDRSEGLSSAASEDEQRDLAETLEGLAAALPHTLRLHQRATRLHASFPASAPATPATPGAASLKAPTAEQWTRLVAFILAAPSPAQGTSGRVGRLCEQILRSGALWEDPGSQPLVAALVDCARQSFAPARPSRKRSLGGVREAAAAGAGAGAGTPVGVAALETLGVIARGVRAETWTQLLPLLADSAAAGAPSLAAILPWLGEALTNTSGSGSSSSSEAVWERALALQGAAYRLVWFTVRHWVSAHPRPAPSSAPPTPAPAGASATAAAPDPSISALLAPCAPPAAPPHPILLAGLLRGLTEGCLPTPPTVSAVVPAPARQQTEEADDDGVESAMMQVEAEAEAEEGDADEKNHKGKGKGKAKKGKKDLEAAKGRPTAKGDHDLLLVPPKAAAPAPVSAPEGRAWQDDRLRTARSLVRRQYLPPPALLPLWEAALARCLGSDGSPIEFAPAEATLKRSRRDGEEKAVGPDQGQEAARGQGAPAAGDVVGAMVGAVAALGLVAGMRKDPLTEGLRALLRRAVSLPGHVLRGSPAALFGSRAAGPALRIMAATLGASFHAAPLLILPAGASGAPAEAAVELHRRAALDGLLTMQSRQRHLGAPLVTCLLPSLLPALDSRSLGPLLASSQELLAAEIARRDAALGLTATPAPAAEAPALAPGGVAVVNEGLVGPQMAWLEAAVTASTSGARLHSLRPMLPALLQILPAVAAASIAARLAASPAIALSEPHLAHMLQCAVHALAFLRPVQRAAMTPARLACLPPADQLGEIPALVARLLCATLRYRGQLAQRALHMMSACLEALLDLVPLPAPAAGTSVPRTETQETAYCSQLHPLHSTLSLEAAQAAARVVDAIGRNAHAPFRFHASDLICRGADVLSRSPLHPAARAPVREACHTAVGMLRDTDIERLHVLTPHLLKPLVDELCREGKALQYKGKV